MVIQLKKIAIPHRLLALTVVLLTPFSVRAGSWETEPSDKLKLTLGAQIPSYNFEIMAPSTASGKKANFLPNVGSRTYLGLNYRNLGFSLGLSNPVESRKNELYGQSSSLDFHFRFFGKRTYDLSLKSSLFVQLKLTPLKISPI